MKNYHITPNAALDASNGLVPKENEAASAALDDVSLAGEEFTDVILEVEAADDLSGLEEDEQFVALEIDSHHRNWPPTREQLWTAIAFGAVVLFGAILRFWGLGDKPLHWDESLHAYYSAQLLHDNVDNWLYCAQTAAASCYRYAPVTHGPFQFHAIAFVYQMSAWLGEPDHGINTTTVRIAAATLGTVIVGLPYMLRFHIGKVGAWLACFLFAISPSLVYYSRFAREDIYMACFTLALVMATARYLRSCNGWWLLVAALSLTLSYATSEATFLTIGVYGLFLGALIVWELSLRWSFVSTDSVNSMKRYLPKTAAPWAVLAYFILIGILAKLVLGEVSTLSTFINKNTKNLATSDAYVAHLKMVTESILPWLGIALAVLVFVILIREQKMPESEFHKRRGLARHVDPEKQPLLDTIVTMPWTHWFFALVCSCFVFMILFTVLFTNVPGGLGDGIWQGLYYWTQQQQVARGGEPWYYYLILIPLYEQIGLVFGLAGVVRCILRPTRLRLFLVFWFVGNVFIYSWAGEKMPWLTIFMTMPMMLLAAIALEPAVVAVMKVVKARFGYDADASTIVLDNAIDSSSIERDVDLSETEADLPAKQTDLSGHEATTSVKPVHFFALAHRRRYQLAGSVTTVLLALLLLIPTLQNMFQLSFVHYADAPHEMMIYVQTTTAINAVMDKVAAVDQHLDGGKYTLPIGLTEDSTWPFAWYMRDYTSACFQFTQMCSGSDDPPIIIVSATDIRSILAKYGQIYDFQQYAMRTQWDQGYMPPPCVPGPGMTCPVQQYTGVGPGLWLSYGDNLPPHAQFNLGNAIVRIWNWIWYRQAFGSTTGSYDTWLLIRKDVVQQTGIKP